MKGVSQETPFVADRPGDVSVTCRCPLSRSSQSHSSHRTDRDHPDSLSRSRRSCRRSRPSRRFFPTSRTYPTPMSRTSPTSPMSLSSTGCSGSLRFRCGRSARSVPCGSRRHSARPSPTARESHPKSFECCLRPGRRCRGCRPVKRSPTALAVPKSLTGPTAGRPVSRSGPTTHSSHPGSRWTSPSSCRDRSSGEPPSPEVDPSSRSAIAPRRSRVAPQGA
jgi:hypothetical protein